MRMKCCAYIGTDVLGVSYLTTVLFGGLQI